MILRWQCNNNFVILNGHAYYIIIRFSAVEITFSSDSLLMTVVEGRESFPPYVTFHTPQT